ncbi:major facilitator superfamily domain-containing protein [Schizophyllum amplum]|uniref:Lysosomal dipeptide transporter MFSD1 n=1 Tax=Schizophyllum amplum TaxID=97359 RepID=A0A550CNJ7_9AGAR|nr:major facilitator superfamily domain-containing protein [Auriculariopsis ampla]
MASSPIEEPSTYDHRRQSCNSLLESSAPREDTDESDVEPGSPADADDFLGRCSSPENDHMMRTREQILAAQQRRAAIIRALALLCACSLSVGSHYANYVLGPLKSRLARELGASHTEFSLLFSAYSLNSTWTSLVGGALASKLGTTATSVIATGIILIGQLLLLLGHAIGSIRTMALGMFVFGIAVSPLAVVQETIIVRFFRSHGLGVSLALGLLAGKGASFVSARTSYPLAARFGAGAPFAVATGLATFSFAVNLVYVGASRWLVDGAHAELEAADVEEEAKRRGLLSVTEAQALEKVAAKKRVRLRSVVKLGDVFWAYVFLNVLCGAIWSPFVHLAANIIETRYSMPEDSAANQASYLLAGSIFMYPLCGFLVDRFKHRPIVIQLLVCSSMLTLLCYAWLALPSPSPIPGIIAFAIGHGFSPLLLVVLVPKIVPLKYVSTALGVHKSLENCGSTIFQTIAGLALDIHKRKIGGPSSDPASLQRVLNIFLFLNVLQLLAIMTLAWLQRRRTRRAGASRVTFDSRPISGARDGHTAPTSEDADPTQPLLAQSSESGAEYAAVTRAKLRGEAHQRAETARGKVFAGLCGLLVVFCWVLFMGTAYFRLGLREGKGEFKD